MNRRKFIKTIGIAGISTLMYQNIQAIETKQKPNFIFIFTDDQGYQDLSCYGSPTIKTPNIDKMAAEGTKFTSFYAQTVCGPSRAALMTGCYPNRVMRTVNIQSDWFIKSDELTIAEVLKTRGYATGCIGKWDLSCRNYVEGQTPLDQGFDYYYGPLTHTDNGPVKIWENNKNTKVKLDRKVVTKQYTDKAINFIEKNKNNPFFLYFPHTMPHTELGATEQFRKGSTDKKTLYRDVMHEIDWNVGRILDAVKKAGIDNNTYIVFTSDNGPAKGSALPLRGKKGSSWEGAVRVPCIMRAPGKIPAGKVCNELISTLDILPTFAALAGAATPNDRIIDGKDQTPMITGQSAKSAQNTFYYYVYDNLHAVREGKWKLILTSRKRFYRYTKERKALKSPELYDLENDVSETTDVSAKNPDIVKQLLTLAENVREDIGDMDIVGKNTRLPVFKKSKRPPKYLIAE